MRVYTFGCSFTSYNWPTWADMLIHNAVSLGGIGENWARSGAGNQYIATKIWECNARNEFTNNDWIFVCWSGFTREDRYTDAGWQTPGNFLTAQNIYKNDFIKSWGHPKHYAMRDAMLIKSTQLALSQLNVNHVHWSMQSLETNQHNSALDSFEEVFALYNIQFDSPPMMDFVPFDKSRIKTFWDNLPVFVDGHPLPHEHFNYLKKNIQRKVPWIKNGFTKETLEFIDLWSKKILSTPQPVPLNHTGWNLPTINQW